jgi:hypothetical protein
VVANNGGGGGGHRKNHFVTKHSRQPRTWADSLARPHRKMEMRFGTWNVRSLYTAGSVKTVARESGKCELDLVGVQGVRWDKGGIKRAGTVFFCT